jgi:hypothetical protein
MKVCKYNFNCCQILWYYGKNRNLACLRGRAVAQAVSRGVSPWRPGFELGSGHLGFVVNKVALRRVFSDYFGFPLQSFYWLLNTHHYLSSGVSTTGQIVDSVSPHPIKLKKGLGFWKQDVDENIWIEEGWQYRRLKIITWKGVSQILSIAKENSNVQVKEDRCIALLQFDCFVWTGPVTKAISF